MTEEKAMAFLAAKSEYLSGNRLPELKERLM